MNELVIVSAVKTTEDFGAEPGGFRDDTVTGDVVLLAPRFFPTAGCGTMPNFVGNSGDIWVT